MSSAPPYLPAAPRQKLGRRLAQGRAQVRRHCAARMVAPPAGLDPPPEPQKGLRSGGLLDGPAGPEMCRAARRACRAQAGEERRWVLPLGDPSCPTGHPTYTVVARLDERCESTIDFFVLPAVKTRHKD